jgi:hypothetical protein
VCLFRGYHIETCFYYSLWNTGTHTTAGMPYFFIRSLCGQSLSSRTSLMMFSKCKVMPSTSKHADDLPKMTGQCSTLLGFAHGLDRRTFCNDVSWYHRAWCRLKELPDYPWLGERRMKLYQNFEDLTERGKGKGCIHFELIFIKCLQCVYLPLFI